MFYAKHKNFSKPQFLAPLCILIGNSHLGPAPPFFLTCTWMDIRIIINNKCHLKPFLWHQWGQYWNLWKGKLVNRSAFFLLLSSNELSNLHETLKVCTWVPSPKIGKKWWWHNNCDLKLSFMSGQEHYCLIWLVPSHPWSKYPMVHPHKQLIHAEEETWQEQC